jgi:FAD synthase
VAVGHDFRCGHEISTDAEGVCRHFEDAGIPVRHLNPVMASGTVVSSTQIRTLVRTGHLRDATARLGGPFALDISRDERATSANETRIRLDGKRLLPHSRQIVPSPGRYPAVAVDEDGERTTVLTVVENSISLPLAPQTRIKYIVLQEERV